MRRIRLSKQSWQGSWPLHADWSSQPGAARLPQPPRLRRDVIARAQHPAVRAPVHGALARRGGARLLDTSALWTDHVRAQLRRGGAVPCRPRAGERLILLHVWSIAENDRSTIMCTSLTCTCTIFKDIQRGMYDYCFRWLNLETKIIQNTSNQLQNHSAWDQVQKIFCQYCTWTFDFT